MYQIPAGEDWDDFLEPKKSKKEEKKESPDETVQ